MQIVYVAIGVIALFFLKISIENRKSGQEQMVSGKNHEVPDNDEPDDKDLTVQIRELYDADELMEFVNDWEELDDNNSAALLSKAMSFEDDLSEKDWAEIYSIAAEGSGLEKIAEEKAGDELV